jgi:hypothetical protein
MKLARAELARLLPDAKDWTLIGLTLMPWPGSEDQTHWLYDVRFVFHPPGAGGIPDEIHIPLLMSGAVGRAKVTPDQK